MDDSQAVQLMEEVTQRQSFFEDSRLRRKRMKRTLIFSVTMLVGGVVLVKLGFFNIGITLFLLSALTPALLLLVGARKEASNTQRAMRSFERSNNILLGRNGPKSS